MYVHSAIHNLNNAIEGSGIPLPKTQLLTYDFKKEDLQNKIVIMPPGLLGSKLLKKIMKEITRNIIPIRPGRSFVRRMTLRANKNPLNKKKAL